MSREEERRLGWRSRISDVLESWGTEVFDPWFKPLVRNLGRYGVEDETTTEAREAWVFEDTPEGALARSQLSGAFWPIMHVDLHMVDLSDFLIACCPTNLYSVGTPHEIVVARQQRKPVLVVSPQVRYPHWNELRRRVADDPELSALVGAAAHEGVVRENLAGVPSQWYMTLVGSESFFDGFGWASFRDDFEWPTSYLDEREAAPHEPVRPLLPYLDALRHRRLPQRWDRTANSYRDNDDWLLLERRAREEDEGRE